MKTEELNIKLIEKLEELKETGFENTAKTALLYSMYSWNKNEHARKSEAEAGTVVLKNLSEEAENAIVSSLVGTVYHYFINNFTRVFEYIFIYENYEVIEDACGYAHEVVKTVVETTTEFQEGLSRIIKFLSGYDTWEAWETYATECGGSITEQLDRPLYWSVRLLAWIKFYEDHYEEGLLKYEGKYREGLLNFLGEHIIEKETKDKKVILILDNAISFPANYLENSAFLLKKGFLECKEDYSYYSEIRKKMTTKYNFDYVRFYKNHFKNYVKSNKSFKDASQEVIKAYLEICISNSEVAEMLYKHREDEEGIFEQVSKVQVWLHVFVSGTWPDAVKQKLVDALKIKFSKSGMVDYARVLTDDCLRLADALGDEDLKNIIIERFKERDGWYWKQEDANYEYTSDNAYWRNADKEYCDFVNDFYPLVCELRIGDKTRREKAKAKMENLLKGESVHYKSVGRELLEKEGLLITDFEAMLETALEKDDVALLLCCVAFFKHVKVNRPEKDFREIIGDELQGGLAKAYENRMEETLSTDSTMDRLLCSYILLKNRTLLGINEIENNGKETELKELIEGIAKKEKNDRFRYYDNSVWDKSLADLFESIMRVEAYEDVNRYGMLLSKFIRIDMGFKRKVKEIISADVDYTNKDMLYEVFLSDFSDADGWTALTKYYYEENNDVMRDAVNLMEKIKYPLNKQVDQFAFTNVKRSLERTDGKKEAPNLLMNNTYLFGRNEDEQYFDEFLNQILRSGKFKYADVRTIRHYVNFFCSIPMKSEEKAEQIAQKYLGALLFALLEQTEQREDVRIAEWLNSAYKPGCRLEQALLSQKLVEGKLVYENSSKLVRFIVKFSELRSETETALQDFCVNVIDAEKLYEKDKKTYDWWKESSNAESEASEEDKCFKKISEIVFSDYPKCNVEKICDALDEYYENKIMRVGKYWELLTRLSNTFSDNIEIQKKVYFGVVGTVSLGSEADSKALEILESTLRNILYSVNGDYNTWDYVRTTKSWYAARYLSAMSKENADSVVFFAQLKHEIPEKFKDYVDTLESFTMSSVDEAWMQDVVYCGITNYWDEFVKKHIVSDAVTGEETLRKNEMKKYLAVIESESFWRRILQILCYASVSTCYDGFEVCKKEFPHTMVSEYFEEETAETHIDRIQSICQMNEFTKEIYALLNPSGNSGETLASEAMEDKQAERILCLRQLDFVLRHSSASRFIRNFNELIIFENQDITMLCLAVLCLFKKTDYLELVDSLYKNSSKDRARTLLKFMSNERFAEHLGAFVYGYCRESDGFEASKDKFLNRIMDMKEFANDSLKENWTNQKKVILKKICNIVNERGIAKEETVKQTIVQPAEKMCGESGADFSHEAFASLITAVKENYPEIYNDESLDEAILYVKKISIFVKEYYTTLAKVIINEEEALSIKSNEDKFIPPVYQNHAKNLSGLVEKYNGFSKEVSEEEDEARTLREMKRFEETKSYFHEKIKSLKLQENSYYGGINLSFVDACMVGEDEDVNQLMNEFRKGKKAPGAKCEIAEKIYYSLLYYPEEKQDLYWKNTFFKEWAFYKIEDMGDGETERKLSILCELIEHTNYLLDEKNEERTELSAEKTDPFGFSAHANKWKNIPAVITYFRSIVDTFFNILDECKLEYSKDVDTEDNAYKVVFSDTKNNNMTVFKTCFAYVRSIYTNILEKVSSEKEAEKRKIEAEKKIEEKLKFVDAVVNENVENLAVMLESMSGDLDGFAFVGKCNAVVDRYRKYASGKECPIKVYVLNEEEDTSNSIFFAMYNDDSDLEDISLEFYESEDGTGSYDTTQTTYQIASGEFVYEECVSGGDGRCSVQSVCVKVEDKQYVIKPEYRTKLIERPDTAKFIHYLERGLWSQKHVALGYEAGDIALADEIISRLSSDDFNKEFRNAFSLSEDALIGNLQVEGMSKEVQDKVKRCMDDEKMHTIVLWKDFSFGDQEDQEEIKKWWGCNPSKSKVSFVFVLSKNELKNKPANFSDTYIEKVKGERLFRDCLGVDRWYIPPYHRTITNSALECLEVWTNGDVDKAKEWIQEVGNYLEKYKIERRYVYPSDFIRALDGLEEKKKNELMCGGKNELMGPEGLLGALLDGKSLGRNVLLPGAITINGPVGGTHINTDGGEVNIAQTMNFNYDEHIQVVLNAQDEKEFDEALGKMEESFKNTLEQRLKEINEQISNWQAKFNAAETKEQEKQYKEEIERLKIKLKDLQENAHEQYCKDFMTALRKLDDNAYSLSDVDKMNLLGYTTEEELRQMEAALVSSDIGVDYKEDCEDALLAYATFKRFNKTNNSLAGFAFGVLTESLLDAYHKKIYDDRLHGTWWKLPGMGSYRVCADEQVLNLRKYGNLSPIPYTLKTCDTNNKRKYPLHFVAFDRKLCSRNLVPANYSRCNNCNDYSQCNTCNNCCDCTGCGNQANCASYIEWKAHRDCLSDENVNGTTILGLNTLRNKAGHPGDLTSDMLERFITLLFKEGGIIRIRKLYDMWKEEQAYLQTQNQAMTQSQNAGGTSTLQQGEYVFTYDRIDSTQTKWVGKIEKDGSRVHATAVIQYLPDSMKTQTPQAGDKYVATIFRSTSTGYNVMVDREY